MNYEIEFSIQAEADLRGIYEYIAFILLAPENAKKELLLSSALFMRGVTWIQSYLNIPSYNGEIGFLILFPH